MPMNQVIQEKRRALGLTQEQLAARLGVSAPAVNKWEKGVTCPDISLLAPLARLLRIDPNELLCFRTELTQQELGQFCAQLTDTGRQSGFDAALALAREKLREYPTCDTLRYYAATVLEGMLLWSELSQAERDGRAAAFGEWYEQLAHSSDETLRSCALYRLSGQYLRAGDCAKAQQMADALPERSALDKRLLQANILRAQGKPGEAAALLECRVLNAVTELQSLLFTLATMEMDAGDAQTAEAVADVASQSAALFGLWPYNIPLVPFETAVRRQDAAAALSLLRRLLAAVFEPWDTAGTPLYHRSADKLGVQAGAAMLPPLLHDLETNPRYDFLREAPAFQALLAEYRAQSG